MIFHETGHVEQAHITSGAFIHRAFLWLREAHRHQCICVDDFTGRCLLWLLSSCKVFFYPHLILQPAWVLGQFWLSSTSSINFLTRRSLNSLWVYLAPHDDNSIQLLSTVRTRRWRNYFMVHLLLGRQRDEYLCSSLEAIPSLVISHLLQSVVQLCWGLQLLPLLFLFFFLKITFNIARLSIWFRVCVSNLNFTDGALFKFNSFPAIAGNLQSSALFRLLCMIGQSWRTMKPLRYGCLIQWQQNRSEDIMWQLYKIPGIQGCPRCLY